jgi:hypothetical protein
MYFVIVDKMTEGAKNSTKAKKEYIDFNNTIIEIVIELFILKGQFII